MSSAATAATKTSARTSGSRRSRPGRSTRTSGARSGVTATAISRTGSRRSRLAGLDREVAALNQREVDRRPVRSLTDRKLSIAEAHLHRSRRVGDDERQPGAFERIDPCGVREHGRRAAANRRAAPGGLRLPTGREPGCRPRPAAVVRPGRQSCARPPASAAARATAATAAVAARPIGTAAPRSTALRRAAASSKTRRPIHAAERFGCRSSSSAVMTRFLSAGSPLSISDRDAARRPEVATERDHRRGDPQTGGRRSASPEPRRSRRPRPARPRPHRAGDRGSAAGRGRVRRSRERGRPEWRPQAARACSSLAPARDRRTTASIASSRSASPQHHRASPGGWCVHWPGRQRLRAPGPAGQLRRGDSFHLFLGPRYAALRAPGAAPEAWPPRSDRREPRTHTRPAPDPRRRPRPAAGQTRCAPPEARSEGSRIGLASMCRRRSAQAGVGPCRHERPPHPIGARRLPRRQLHAGKDHGQASIRRQLGRAGLGHHPAHRRHRFGLVRLRPNRRDASRRRRGGQRHNGAGTIQRDPLLERSGVSV